MDVYESYKKIQLISFQIYVPALIVCFMFEGRGVHGEQVSCTKTLLNPISQELLLSTVNTEAQQ